jgi:Zn-dependent protease with chaperone function
LITGAIRLAFAGSGPYFFQFVLKRFQKGGLAITRILLIVAIIAAVWCIFAAIVCLLAASRENELPDIEDIEIVE